MSLTVGIRHAAIALGAGIILAILSVKVSPLMLSGALLAAMLLSVFLQRPDLGLFFILFARASSDAILVITETVRWDAAGLSLRVALLNPNTVLILILIGAGSLVILTRKLLLLSLPGGALLILLPLTGIAGVIRSGTVISGMDEWIPMLAAPIMYALAAGLFKPHKGESPAHKVLAASFLIPAAFGYSQLLTGEGILSRTDGVVRIYGSFVHPNPFGLYLVIIIAVFLPLALERTRMTTVARVILAATGPLLLATYARFAWVGAIVVLLCVAIRYRALLLIIPLIGLVAFIPSVQMRVTDPFGDSFADRVGIWRGLYYEWLTDARSEGTMVSSLVAIAGGLGPGATPRLAARFRGGDTPAHNDYVRVLVDHGVVGLVLYLSLSATMIYLGYQVLRASRPGPPPALALSFFSLAIAYPIMSFTDNIIAGTVNQLYFWFLAGLCAALRANTSRAGQTARQTLQQTPRPASFPLGHTGS